MGKVNLLLLVLLSILVVPWAGGHGRMVGGRTKVKDVKANREVQELGDFSVREFNLLHRRQGGELVFSEVVEAQVQVVAGLKYCLKVEVKSKDGGQTKVYDSVVVVKPWLSRGSKKLLSFAPPGSTVLNLITTRRM